jgi:hypothetical protein
MALSRKKATTIALDPEADRLLTRAATERGVSRSRGTATTRPARPSSSPLSDGWPRWRPDERLAIKWSLVATLILSSILVGVWTRSSRWALVFHVALAYPIVALGYLDIYFVPFLSLAPCGPSSGIAPCSPAPCSRAHV